MRDNMGKTFLNLMDPDEVKQIVDSFKVPEKVEKVQLTQVYGRVLAEDIHATIDLPPFNRVAMDGYAVVAADTFKASEDNPINLNLIEKIQAGDIPSKTVIPGTCSEVGTGAPLPEGSDSVVMVEFTETDGETVKIYGAVSPGTNMVKCGSDMQKGKLLLSKGTLLTPDKIGVLSAIGVMEVSVYHQPTVAVISTGNELVSAGEKLRYGQLYDINSQSILNAVKSCGCNPLVSTIVKDDYNSIKNKINEFKDVDVIITSGGTSAGAGDILRKVVEDMGDVLVHGISVKPGKPTLIGTLPHENVKIILFGLPGYPVAALMVFQGFVAPFLKKIAGIPERISAAESYELKLARRYHSARGRSHLVLVKIENDRVHPILKDSGAITALAEADGYFEVPKNVEIIEKDETVRVFMLSEF